MPANKQAFTLWNNQVFTNAVVTENGSFVLAQSAEQDNALGGFKSLKLVVDYADIQPGLSNDPQTFDIDVVVEGKSDLGRWYPVAYQFTAYRNPNNGNTRIIQLQPNLSGFDAGVDDVIWVGGTTTARVSRQQGNLPDGIWRVVLRITETGFGGPGAFTSVKISAYGEAFNA